MRTEYEVKNAPRTKIKTLTKIFTNVQVYQNAKNGLLKFPFCQLHFLVHAPA